MILILGASSRIGGHLFNGFKKEGFETVGTYFKNKKDGMRYFNLEDMTLSDLKIDPTHAIVVAAANPRPELSSKLIDSYEINVTKTKSFIDACFTNRIVPVYISSDNVFDGKKGNYAEEDETNPLNNYGKMKAEVENYLFNSGKPYLLLRMGKVFGIENDRTLILETFDKIKKNETFYLAKDQVFTPCYAQDLYEFVRDAVNKNYRGTFHLGSMTPMTRYDLAQKMQEFFDIKNARIVPCEINRLGLAEKRPLKIDLNIDKYKKLTGTRERPIKYFLENIDRL